MSSARNTPNNSNVKRESGLPCSTSLAGGVTINNRRAHTQHSGGTWNFVWFGGTFTRVFHYNDIKDVFLCIETH